MLVSLKNMLHTLNCRSENMPVCHKISIKGQGQGHRNKLAQNVFLFSHA